MIGTRNESGGDSVLKARRNSGGSSKGYDDLNNESLENAILVFGKNNGNNATFVLEVN